MVIRNFKKDFMLKIKNIYKTYKNRKENIIILNNVDYEFKKNNLYCIFGKSGVGKTTLIEILGLLLDFDSGFVIIDNDDISKLNDKEKALIRNKKIGFVFQSYYLNPLMKAYENVMVPMYINKSLNNNNRKKRAFDLLSQMDLKNRENHFPKELSGGEQQRVAIARALANDPEIILADEPTGALDSENAVNVLNILKDLAKKGKCVIIVSHDERVKEYANVVLKIEGKKLKEV